MSMREKMEGRESLTRQPRMVRKYRNTTETVNINCIYKMALGEFIP